VHLEVVLQIFLWTRSQVRVCRRASRPRLAQPSWAPAFSSLPFQI
jgi:hypothetical protein